MNDKLNELITKTARKIRANYAFWAIEEELTNLVAKLQPEPLAVGLTDEQLIDFYDKWGDCTFFDAYKEWAKDQTWAFQPIWADAPAWANWLAQDDTGEWCWFENEPAIKISGGIWDVKGKKQSISYVKNWQQTLQERPKPAPQVEAGQVWKGEGIKVKVGCLGRVSKNGEESIAFVDVDTNELKTWLLKTFLAKFELTGG